MGQPSWLRQLQHDVHVLLSGWGMEFQLLTNSHDGCNTVQWASNLPISRYGHPVFNTGCVAVLHQTGVEQCACNSWDMQARLRTSACVF